MKYRIGTFKDYANIEDVIASTGYYPPVDASLMSGTFTVAEDNEGQLQGCVWVMHYGRNAYLDYLSVHPKYQKGRVGARLLIKTRQMLKRRGVRYVRTSIHLSNTSAIRLGKAFGMTVHSPYVLGFVDIGADNGH